MKSFRHIDARSLEEVLELLELHGPKARVNAGGTDLLGILKDRILSDYPELIINLKTVTELEAVKEDDEGLRVGALTRLSDIAASGLVKKHAPVLAQAARRVAGPQIRNMATLGGNLCQETRCWYFRYPAQIGGPLQCARKGRGGCLAARGDNRYHALFGSKRCLSVCPSDTAVALAVLEAKIGIAGPEGERFVPADDFFTPLGNVLKSEELLTHIRIPAISAWSHQSFLKFTLRGALDFAVVSVASAFTLRKGLCRDARLALGAVAFKPIRAAAAENLLEGSPLDGKAAAEAAEAAAAGAKPLSGNAYKVEIMKSLVREIVSAAGKAA